MTEVFLKLVQLAIQASPLVLAVLVFRLVLKAAPKWVRVLLWGMVGVRLLCPFSLESALSLIPRTEPLSVTLTAGLQPASETVVPPAVPAGNPVFPETSLPQVTAVSNPLKTLTFVLSLVWLVGMLAILFYAVVRYLQLRRRISTAVRMQRSGGRVPLFQSEYVSSPFVMGLFRPRIYLPYHLEDSIQEAVVAHEQAHISRRDHWWKPLGFLILAVYWFHPLLWVAYILFCRDLELACDERVIRRMRKDQRADYSQALLMASVHPKTLSACPLAFGEVGVRQRVQAVLHYKKPAFWVILLALAACGVVAVCFLTSPRTPASSEEAEKVSQGQLVENATVSSAQLPNGMELRLVLIEGTSFSQEETHPGGGIYAENDRGTYALQVWKGEERLSQLEQDALLPLSADGHTLNFQPGFALSLADYNGDGQQDFALSQWFSSSNNICMLFSVDEVGSLSVLPVEGGLIVSGHEFSPLFVMETADSFSFDQYDNESGTAVSRLASWDGQRFVVGSEASKTVLNLANAETFLEQVLSTLTLYEDGTVSFSLPAEIPVSEDGKTQLTITLNATFSDQPGSFSVQPLLDWKTGWTGGQVYQGRLDDDGGTLDSISFSVFFMTEEGPGLYRQYAGDSVELTPPFSYDKPAGYTPPSVEIAQVEGETVLTYTLTNGQQVALSLKLPDSILAKVPEEPAGPYDLLLTRNGSAVGTVSLWGLGTTDQAVLETVAGSDGLPMPVFSTVALSDHAGYEDYQVQQRGETGAAATARYVWQDLSASSGDAASIPWQQQDCVLAYDWKILPFFVEIRLTEGLCDQEELATLARELTWIP